MNWIIIASTNEVLRDLKTMPKLIFTSFQNNSMKGNPDKSFTYCQWKVSKYGVNSCPHFPVFGLNTEIYGVISSPYFPVFGLNTEIYGANNYYTHRLMKICSICKEIESNVNEEELENFLESSATVEIEVNRKINKLKIRVKMKTEPVTASPPPIPRLGNGNRTKRYV